MSKDITTVVPVIDIQIYPDGVVQSRSDIPGVVEMLANQTERTSANLDKLVEVIAAVVVSIRTKVDAAEKKMREMDKVNLREGIDELHKEEDKLRDDVDKLKGQHSELEDVLRTETEELNTLKQDIAFEEKELQKIIQRKFKAKSNKTAPTV